MWEERYMGEGFSAAFRQLAWDGIQTWVPLIGQPDIPPSGFKKTA